MHMHNYSSTYKDQINSINNSILPTVFTFHTYLSSYGYRLNHLALGAANFGEGQHYSRPKRRKRNISVNNPSVTI